MAIQVFYRSLAQRGRLVGTVSQGYTIDEAIANLQEATALYLEEFPLSETGRPLLTAFEVVGHPKTGIRIGLPSP